MSAALDGLATRVRRAARVTVLTGAGVSAASGVPTFRGAGGLWRSYRAESLATPEAFARDPGLVWEWYDWRRSLLAGCVPNPAHEVLAAWTARRGGVTVVTQNVDDLHLRAGTTSLVRLHGSIWELRCWEECGVEAWRDERVPIPELPARCHACGGLARPGVVWFGEMLPQDQLSAAISACACDVFLTVGTSALVHPAAGLVHQARAQGAFTVEINPDATPASSSVDLALRDAAEDVLPQIEERLQRRG
jgi:NAD-dependent deacetylase